MADQLSTVKAYLAAVAAKDIDSALAFFSDDAVIESPAGVQHGKDAIRAMLAVVIARPAPPSPPEPAVENGQVVARGATPAGPVMMRFEFKGDLISRQSVGAG